MVFSSGFFLLYYLPLVITSYLFIPKNFKNLHLLVFSLLFFWWGAPTFIFILLLVCTLNFFISLQIASKNKKKPYLILYITLNLGVLAYFKYANFFAENFNSLLLEFGGEAMYWSKIVLPLGISFLTFHAISYGVDVYRGDAKVQKNIVNFWLYILFFPQLIAGPIITYKSIAKQFSQRQTSKNQIIDGFLRFTIGLCKKVLIANVLSEYGQLLTTHDFTHQSTLIAWLSVLAYTFEIYFDFSGYSDMAIGLAKMFGFTFPENFNRPYLSKSITEFWQRWHITLGNFMKNYLYIPLGGNKKGNMRTYVNLGSVFVLSGLWHGAAWNFVLWGIYHGFWLILERLLLNKKIVSNFVSLRIAFTFFIVVIGWCLFKANNWNEASSQLFNLFSFAHFDYFQDRQLLYYEIHLCIAALICLLGFSSKLHALYFVSISKIESVYIKCSVFMLMGLFYLIALSHVVTGSFNPFIYFKF
jgi:alginate O-acetyltransferase complex protein AlgI